MSPTSTSEQISQPNTPNNSNTNSLNRSDSTTQLQPFDGVFSNIDAKPDIMKLPPPEELDPPPPYTTGHSLPIGATAMNNPRLFPPGSVNSPSAITRELDCEDIMVSGKSLGSYWTFFFATIPPIVFTITGFLLMFYISESHSTFYGSLVGLGISILVNTVDICDFLLAMGKVKNREERRILEAFIIIIGLIFVIYPWSLYDRMRRRAREQRAIS